MAKVIGLLPVEGSSVPHAVRFMQVLVKQMPISPASAIIRPYRPARSQWLLLRSATQAMPCALASSMARAVICSAISGPTPKCAS